MICICNSYVQPSISKTANADSKADGDVAKNSEIKCISYAEVCIMKRINHAISNSASYASRNKFYKNVET